MNLSITKANLIQNVRELMAEGQISKPEDVAKHFAPNEIALIADFLVSIFPEKERL